MAKVIGNIVGVPNPKSDWNQNDATKADFIKNKPTKLSQFENDCGFSKDDATFVVTFDGDKSNQSFNEIAEAITTGKRIVMGDSVDSSIRYGCLYSSCDSREIRLVAWIPPANGAMYAVCTNNNQWVITYESYATRLEFDERMAAIESTLGNYCTKEEVDEKIKNIEVGSLFGDQTKQLDESLFRLGTVYYGWGKLNYESKTGGVCTLKDGVTYTFEKGEKIICSNKVNIRLIHILGNGEYNQLVNYDKKEFVIETTGEYSITIYQDGGTNNETISELVREVKIQSASASAFLETLEELKTKLSNITTKKLDNSAKGVFSIMTYNVGNWYNGSGQRVPDTKHDSYYELQKSIIDRYEPDILCTQEYMSHLGEEILAEKYYSIANALETSAYDGKAICTNRTLEGAENIYFAQTDACKRNYEKAYIYLNGRKVCVISAHLATSAAICKQEAVELLNAVSDEEYFILCIDSNVDMHDTTSDLYVGSLKLFVDAGYKLCNGGEFGIFNTYADNENGAIDNIIVSGNISIKSVVMDTQKEGLEDGSDHYPLIAYVEIGHSV